MFVITKEKIKFPVNFDLKVIMKSQAKNDENERVIIDILLKLNISFCSGCCKLSSRGKYVSLTFNVTLGSREIMNALYSELAREPGVRFAV